MSEPKIINYLEINGKEVRLDLLDEVQRREAAERLQLRMMGAVGFKQMAERISA